MPRRNLTAEWSIDLEESFEGRVVDGDLQLVSGGMPPRTLWVAIWNPPPELPVEEVLQTLAGDLNPDPVERFEEPGSAPQERRLASWYPEEVEGRPQWGLYGYTVRPGCYVQLAVLVDSPEDRDWALTAWRSLRYQPAAG